MITGSSGQIAVDTAHDHESCVYHAAITLPAVTGPPGRPGNSAGIRSASLMRRDDHRQFTTSAGGGLNSTRYLQKPYTLADLPRRTAPVKPRFARRRHGIGGQLTPSPAANGE